MTNTESLLRSIIALMVSVSGSIQSEGEESFDVLYHGGWTLQHLRKAIYDADQKCPNMLGYYTKTNEGDEIIVVIDNPDGQMGYFDINAESNADALVLCDRQWLIQRGVIHE